MAAYLASLFSSSGAASGAASAASSASAASAASSASAAAAASSASAVSAAAAANGAAAAGSSIFNLSNVATAFSAVSALSSIGSAGNEAALLRSNALFAEFNANQAALEGTRAANDELDELLDILADQNVAFSANGIDLAFGTPVTAGREAVITGTRAVNAERLAGQANALSERARSRSLLLQADNARLSGFAGAIGTIGQDAARRSARG